MEIEYDEDKRRLVLEDRNLDLARAGEVFEQFTLVRRDDKHSTDAEERFHTVGMLDDEVVIITWTRREVRRRIVTMWKANDKERQKYHQECERPG